MVNGQGGALARPTRSHRRKTMSQPLNSQLKPRCEWDEDEIYDGRPKTAEIEILVVQPVAPPELLTIPNSLRAMQRIVGGTITCFQTGIPGTIGVCHDEGILLGFPPCRYVEKTGALIFGTFFLSGDGVNMHSLTLPQIAQCLDVFGPRLTGAQIFAALKREAESIRMIEEWNGRGEDEEEDESEE